MKDIVRAIQIAIEWIRDLILPTTRCNVRIDMLCLIGDLIDIVCELTCFISDTEL